MITSKADSWRDAFLREIAPSSSFYSLFNHLAGISFFAKNARYEIVCASQSFLERLGRNSEREIQGLTDYELFPRALADNFRTDDEWVIRNDAAKTNIVELFVNEGGLPDWYLTNKLPIHGRDGNVIGVMGTTQSYQDGKEFIAPYLEIEPAIEYIRHHFRTRISIRKVAEHLGVSLRQVDRKFQTILKMSPQEFITRLRMKDACNELRNSNRLILDIALDLGFYDQSSFTVQFRKHMGTTPLRYRKQIRRESITVAEKPTNTAPEV